MGIHPEKLCEWCGRKIYQDNKDWGDQGRWYHTHSGNSACLTYAKPKPDEPDTFGDWGSSVDTYASEHWNKARCRRAPRGWRCKLVKDHDGPCPAYPEWWNIKGWIWHWKASR